MWRRILNFFRTKQGLEVKEDMHRDRASDAPNYQTTSKQELKWFFNYAYAA